MIWHDLICSWSIINQLLNLIRNSLFHSLHRSHLIVDRFQTNNRLISPHGLLYNADSLIQTLILVQSSVFIACLRAVLRYMHMLMSKYQQSKYTATDSNNLKCHIILLYSQNFTFHWKLLVYYHHLIMIFHPSSFPLITRRDNEWPSLSDLHIIGIGHYFFFIIIVPVFIYR